MNDRLIPSQIIYSKRKTTALQIKPDSSLVIRAPLKASKKYLQDLIQRKSKWILKKQQEVLQRGGESATKKKCILDEEFSYLGKNYKLKFCPDQTKNIILDEKNHFIFIKELKKDYARIVLIKFYQQEALRIISKRVEFFATKFRFKFKDIKLSNAKTKWGSCSSRDNLRFSWRLAMLPMEIIDYVVVHELCHTMQKNHSQKFWNLVKEILPDYKEKQKALKGSARGVLLLE
jgi:predicted metal-dependent hydrolase